MTEFKLDLSNGELLIGGKRAVLHCNHYNTFLQRTLVDALGDKMVEVQIKISQKINTEMLRNLTQGIEDKKSAIEKIFSALGLGILDLNDLENGRSTVSNSHYALNCYYKFGNQKEGVCLFATGYVRAAAEILTGQKKDFFETRCISIDPDQNEMCVFEVRT